MGVSEVMIGDRCGGTRAACLGRHFRESKHRESSGESDPIMRIRAIGRPNISNFGLGETLFSPKPSKGTGITRLHYKERVVSLYLCHARWCYMIGSNRKVVFAPKHSLLLLLRFFSQSRHFEATPSVFDNAQQSNGCVEGFRRCRYIFLVPASGRSPHIDPYNQTWWPSALLRHSNARPFISIARLVSAPSFCKLPEHRYMTQHSEAASVRVPRRELTAVGFASCVPVPVLCR